MRALAYGVLAFVLGCKPSTPDLVLVPITEPPVARAAWRAAARCSEAPEVPGGSLAEVHWFAGNLREHDPHHTLIGAWFTPNMIVLDVSVVNDPRVVEHELLHHRLRGPPGNAHPFVPFVIPCAVMELQVGG